MRDLQRRLHAIGFDCGAAEPGEFSELTEQAVTRFQVERGLTPSGRCDQPTWAALVEAGFRLGDRQLFLRAPVLRGDDVAELQRTLGTLGFDAGRVDGIFGAETRNALTEFQRNTGLPTDGICGYETTAALRRYASRHDGLEGVAAVRERESLLAQPRTLHGRRIVIGHFGGLGSLTRSVARAARTAGGLVLALDDRPASEQAVAANEFSAEVYLGLCVASDRSGASFYATEGFRSAGGERLASLLVDDLNAVLSRVRDAPSAMRLPILRETRMPAVLVELGPVSEVVLRAPQVTVAILTALQAWVSAPFD